MRLRSQYRLDPPGQRKKSPVGEAFQDIDMLREILILFSTTIFYIIAAYAFPTEIRRGRIREEKVIQVTTSTSSGLRIDWLDGYKPTIYCQILGYCMG